MPLKFLILTIIASIIAFRHFYFYYMPGAHIISCMTQQKVSLLHTSATQQHSSFTLSSTAPMTGWWLPVAGPPIWWCCRYIDAQELGVSPRATYTALPKQAAMSNIELMNKQATRLLANFCMVSLIFWWHYIAIGFQRSSHWIWCHF